MSDVRLAAMLTDDQLADELMLAHLAKRDPDQDIEYEALDRLFHALTSEAAARWWRARQRETRA